MEIIVYIEEYQTVNILAFATICTTSFPGIINIFDGGLLIESPGDLDPLEETSLTSLAIFKTTPANNYIVINWKPQTSWMEWITHAKKKW